MEWIGEAIGGAVALLVLTWLAGFLSPYSLSPGRVRLTIANILKDKPQQAEDRFRFVLCWLENDSKGHNTSIVAQAFSGVQGITLLRSARIATASGAADDWQPDIQRNARAVLGDWNADLAVVGLVKKSGEALSLWFVPRLGEGTLNRGDRPYKLENVTLGADFHDDLHAELTAYALAAVAPRADTRIRSRVLGKV